MRILVFFSSVLLFAAVSCSKPSVLEEEKFIEVYTDLVIAQDTSIVADNSFLSVKDSIFRKHNITEKEYNETLDYYNEDPERWDQFFNKAIERLERLKKQYGKKP